MIADANLNTPAVRRPKAHRGKTTSEAEFRRLYHDRSLTLAQIGQRLGITQQAVCHRAERRGLVNIRTLGPNPAIADDASFQRLWAAGVRTADMAAHFGVHERSIRNHVTRLGLPKRLGAGRPKRAADATAKMLARMDAEAAATRAAMELSEMVDRVTPRRAA